jgi:hypothetical protein
MTYRNVILALVAALIVSASSLAAPGVYFTVTSKQLPKADLTATVGKAKLKLFFSDFSLRVVAGPALTVAQMRNSGIPDQIKSVALVSGGESQSFTKGESNPNADKRKFTLQSSNVKTAAQILHETKKISFYLSGANSRTAGPGKTKRAVFSADSEILEGLNFNEHDEIVIGVVIDDIHTAGNAYPDFNMTVEVLKNGKRESVKSAQERNNYSLVAD